MAKCLAAYLEAGLTQFFSETGDWLYAPGTTAKAKAALLGWEFAAWVSIGLMILGSAFYAFTHRTR